MRTYVKPDFLLPICQARFSVMTFLTNIHQIGKKVPIIFVLVLNFFWTLISLVNSFYISTFPTWIFILQNGVLLGIMGGSNFAICTLSTAYVAMGTPIKKRASRFSLILVFALMGFVVGPLISGPLVARHLYLEIFASTVGLAFLTLILAIITLKRDPIDVISEESIIQLEETSSITKKVILSLQLQLSNFKDLFATSHHVRALVASITMFMLTTVGLICPLSMISTVYALGDPFDWSTSFRSYFFSGTLNVV